uniref:ATP6V1F neighbor n=1 Tax=Chelydra serpentina TaxID=8475 RepID=A0A8C3SFG7_CHESE
MARQLNMDTLQQDFWKEEYLKELMLRFRWHQRYGASVKAKQQQVRQRQQAAREPLKLPALPSPAPAPPAQPPPEEPAGAAQDGEMRPVAPEVRRLLYQGISQDGEGRRRYLARRTARAPEEKYYTPVTSNFVYGWQMGEPGRGGQGPARAHRGGFVLIVQ